MSTTKKYKSKVDWLPIWKWRESGKISNFKVKDPAPSLTKKQK
jgi:hypothetical protein